MPIYSKFDTTFVPNSTYPVSSLSCLPSGRAIAAANTRSLYSITIDNPGKIAPPPVPWFRTDDTLLNVVAVAPSRGASTTPVIVGCDSGQILLLQVTEDPNDSSARGIQIQGKPTICQLPNTLTPSSITSLAWAPDASAFATGAFSGSISVWSAAGGHRAILTQRSANLIRALSFSPDSGYLAAISGTTLVVYGLRAGVPTSYTLPQTAQPSSAFTSLVWATQDHVLVGTESGLLYVFFPSTGRFRALSGLDPAIAGSAVMALAITPNSGAVAVSCSNGNVLTVSLSSFDVLSIGRVPSSVSAVTFAQFGSTAASVVVGCSAGSVACTPAITLSASMSTLSFVQSSPDSLEIVRTSGVPDKITLAEGVLDAAVTPTGFVVVAPREITVYGVSSGSVKSGSVAPFTEEMARIETRCESGRVLLRLLGSRTQALILDQTARTIGRAVVPNHSILSLGAGALTVVDGKSIQLMDERTGRPLPNGLLKHSVAVRLAHPAVVDGEPRLAWLDANRDLFVAPLAALSDSARITGGVLDFCWIPGTPLLAFITQSGEISVVVSPGAFIAPELIEKSITRVAVLTQQGPTHQLNVQLCSPLYPDVSPLPPEPIDPLASLSATASSLLTVSIPSSRMAFIPISPLLANVAQRSTAAGLQLARRARSPVIWLQLAASSIEAGDYPTASVALASLRCLPASAYVRWAARAKDQTLVQALLLAFRGRKAESEQLLIGGGLTMVFFAVRLATQLGDYRHALELAQGPGKSDRRLLSWLVSERARYLTTLGIQELDNDLEQVAGQLGDSAFEEGAKFQAEIMTEQFGDENGAIEEFQFASIHATRMAQGSSTSYGGIDLLNQLPPPPAEQQKPSFDDFSDSVDVFPTRPEPPRAPEKPIEFLDDGLDPVLMDELQPADAPRTDHKQDALDESLDLDVDAAIEEPMGAADGQDLVFTFDGEVDLDNADFGL